MGEIRKSFLFSSTTAVGTSSVSAGGLASGGKKTFQLVNIATGTSAVTAVVQASNDATNFITLGTISATGTGATVTAGYTVDEAWGYWRTAITAIGSSAAVTVICCEEMTH